LDGVFIRLDSPLRACGRALKSCGIRSASHPVRPLQREVKAAVPRCRVLTVGPLLLALPERKSLCVVERA
jgi:hypothetical protein